MPLYFNPPSPFPLVHENVIQYIVIPLEILGCVHKMGLGGPNYDFTKLWGRDGGAVMYL